MLFRIVNGPSFQDCELILTTEPDHNTPQVGYYKRKLVKGGPWVGVHIERHCICQDQDLHVWNDDCDRYPHELTARVQGVMIEDAQRHWLYCMANPITEKQYNHLLNLQDWAEEHAPRDPYARTDQAIDHMKIKSLF